MRDPSTNSVEQDFITDLSEIFAQHLTQAELDINLDEVSVRGSVNQVSSELRNSVVNKVSVSLELSGVIKSKEEIVKKKRR